MRTLLIVCASAMALAGCSSQQSTQPSCGGLNPFACLTAVQVPIEAESRDSDTATAKPVSTVAWRGNAPPQPHVDHAVHRTPRPIKVAAKPAAAVPLPVRSPQATGKAVVSEAARASDAASASDTAPASEATLASEATRASATDPQTRTTQEQVAAASAVAERMSVPTLDASLDALVAILVASPDVKSISDLAGKTVAIDDRYSEQSISRVRTAMAAAGAGDVQLSKGRTNAISRLVGKEVAAAIVGLVSTSAADSFPELARLRTFRVPLSARSPNKLP